MNLSNGFGTRRRDAVACGGCPGGGVRMYHAVPGWLADGGARDRPTNLKTGRLR